MVGERDGLEPPCIEDMSLMAPQMVKNILHLLTISLMVGMDRL